MRATPDFIMVNYLHLDAVSPLPPCSGPRLRQQSIQGAALLAGAYLPSRFHGRCRGGEPTGLEEKEKTRCVSTPETPQRTGMSACWRGGRTQANCS